MNKATKIYSQPLNYFEQAFQMVTTAKTPFDLSQMERAIDSGGWSKTHLSLLKKAIKASKQRETIEIPDEDFPDCKELNSIHFKNGFTTYEY